MDQNWWLLTKRKSQGRVSRVYPLELISRQFVIVEIIQSEPSWWTVMKPICTPVFLTLVKCSLVRLCLAVSAFLKFILPVWRFCVGSCHLLICQSNEFCRFWEKKISGTFLDFLGDFSVELVGSRNISRDSWSLEQFVRKTAMWLSLVFFFSFFFHLWWRLVLCNSLSWRYGDVCMFVCVKHGHCPQIFILSEASWCNLPNVCVKRA